MLKSFGSTVLLRGLTYCRVFFMLESLHAEWSTYDKHNFL